MAEIVGIAAGIGSILKTLTSTGIYLQGIGSASREAQEFANQVQTTEAILKSLQASLKTIHRSQEFHDVWGESTKLVLANIQTTTDQLNKRLGPQGSKARLSLWSKVKWPLDREEGLVLQQHMQAYMQMLSMVQNAFMQWVWFVRFFEMQGLTLFKRKSPNGPGLCQRDRRYFHGSGHLTFIDGVGLVRSNDIAG